MQSRWLAAGGFRVHVRLSPGAPLPRGGAGTEASPGAGTKPPLVLLHGAVISGNYFGRIAPMLARWYDVYVPDLPGQGRSDKLPRALTVPEAAELLRAWLDAAGIARASIVAHSLGCQTVAHLAADHPERVERLVLIGATVAPGQRTPWAVLWRLAVDALRERKSLVILEAIDLLRVGLRRGWQTMQAAFDDRIEETLPRVRQPTLVVRGSRDLLMPRAWAKRLTALLPHGALLELEGSPHAVHYTDAERTLAPIVAFLRGPGALAEAGAPGPATRQASGPWERASGTEGPDTTGAAGTTVAP